MEAALRARVEAEARLDVVAKERVRIAELLTLKCPRCGQAFHDFDKCFALVCPRPGCHAGFCGWCLTDCGVDAHRHVAFECAVGRQFGKPNPTWGSREQFEEA